MATLQKVREKYKKSQAERERELGESE